MRILLTGGTGFIGQALIPILLERGHHITLSVHRDYENYSASRFFQAVNWCNNLSNINPSEIDAIINLAGEPIFSQRWSAQRKQQLVFSRTAITQQLVQLIQHKASPIVFLSASATGFYGNVPVNEGVVDERYPMGEGFLPQLCADWEYQALKAEKWARVCLLRTGLVLSPQGGMLKQLLPLYRWGLGSKIATGEQHWPWISLDDHIRAILFLLENEQAKGVFNLVSPSPTKQIIFSQSLAKQLRRPVWLTQSVRGLKAILGERAQLLLDNQPLVPQRLQELGFEFHCATLEWQKLI